MGIITSWLRGLKAKPQTSEVTINSPRPTTGTPEELAKFDLAMQNSSKIAHSLLTGPMEEVADFMDHHDTIFPEVTVRKAGFEVSLTGRRLPKPAEEKPEPPKDK